ncbi:hypothetical protein ACQRWP_14135 [Micromonospora trifolii]|uniref:hypothetical protein n=1 Tax=Micromonospora trifolii TaxID=2911208 RepID=UPI003D2F0ABC
MKRAALYVIAGPVGIVAYGLVRLWARSDGVRMLAVRRRLPWWSVPLLLAGIVLPTVTLDLLPVGGLCMALALAPALPLVRQQSERAESAAVFH